ncbi:MAG TPA: thioesterase family protein [Myxococcales bacterium]|jgi:acyl-CoA thioester hydrolase|nr:thioesterase family protein [Myxococcales bacterium]
MADAALETRDRFAHFTEIATRWGDNDVYGHVNNAVYYAYFDTVVNRFLIERGLLDLEGSPAIGIVVETGCRFHRPLVFPDAIDAGLRVAKIGNSSVRYELGLFRRGDPVVAASAHFVHVYVDRAARRPVPVPPEVRTALESLVVKGT